MNRTAKLLKWIFLTMTAPCILLITILLAELEIAPLESLLWFGLWTIVWALFEIWYSLEQIKRLLEVKK